MAAIVKEILARPIQLADQVTKAADEAHSFKQDCAEIKSKTEKLAGLLRQAARASNELYERPTRRIIDETEQNLDKALTLVIKCRANGLMKRVFTIIPAAAFRKTAQQLENSIGDMSWLLRVSAPSGDRDDVYLGLPPIASNEPILCLIWEQVAILYTGSAEDRADAAASLVSLAKDNNRYVKLIIEEGGVPPLLKMAKEGGKEGQENAARAIGLLGQDPESVEQIVNAGVCPVFAKILKEGHMKVQTEVALAVSEFADRHPKCQDPFAQNNVIRLLVSHLAFETIQEHSKYVIPNKQQLSIHSIVMANNNPTRNEYDHNKHPGGSTAHVSHPITGNHNPINQMQSVVNSTLASKKSPSPSPGQGHDQSPGHSHGHSPGPGPGQGMKQPGHHNQNQNQNQNYNVSTHHHHPHPNHNNAKTHHPNHVALSGASIKGREYEDPETKAKMKAMAARALWKLAKGNVAVCRSITESRALLCFAVLLEKGSETVQGYSAKALMEITAVAEQNADLRRNAFKPTSPACKAVVEQLLKIIEEGNSHLLEPCIQAVGNLARTFRATETRLIGPLVKLLDERETDISAAAVIALNKFACTENFLHLNHCKAIIDAGGAKHLIQLVYFGEQMVQIPSLILLCYISLHIPDSETLAQEEVLIVLEWSSKQAHLVNEPSFETLLPEAKSRLELYQSRGTRGFY
ncbi:PREDICTED: uncharacterized protein LOC103334802 [Prunus mume]|uniref:Uncharacterized protein LOC103334802 n=1 Tax=Prunus mume TaxID=102107 RepID=A0ABM0P8S2_PRUMU|nr:PREDICTED: uncharacterized protein LOC103334802 [Prunus mume]